MSDPKDISQWTDADYDALLERTDEACVKAYGEHFSDMLDDNESPVEGDAARGDKQ